MPRVIKNVVVADSEAPFKGKPQSIVIDGDRISEICDELPNNIPANFEVYDASGKFAIPGILNANVHLLGDIRMEVLVRYADRFADLIVEAAQVALASGLTTVFDTWGPRRHLIEARERIASGKDVGSRIFCAGNIVGFEGPFSDDFIPKAQEVASGALASRINATWVENVGRHLMWLPAEEVGREVSSYAERGIDFVKYASNEHYWASAGAFIQFSPHAQREIVEAAHRSGKTAQAHCMSVEGLRLAVEAGCDLIQHCNITGPRRIPEQTLSLLEKRQTGAVVFPWTQAGLEWIRQNVTDMEWTMWEMSNENAKLLVEAGIPILLANDGAIFSPETKDEPLYDKSWGGAPAEYSLISLAQGHFNWLTAMEEKGLTGQELLKAATINVARAYGLADELGSITVSKAADIVILDSNPLETAKNYRSISAVFKNGAPVDRKSLPTNPVLTRSGYEPTEEELRYKPFLSKAAAVPFLPCSCR